MKIAYKILLIPLLLFFFLGQLRAQEKTIKGIVSDASTGEALPGATILISGTTNGTTSDLDGNYTLTYTEGNTLTVSFIGYLKEDLEIGNQSNINIQLMPDFAQLDEIVVIGYGTQKKVDLTGAVSNIAAEDMESLPLAGADQALQGKAAGVNVTQNTGAPGEGVSVRIRGVGSINSGNDPLYIVDGVPTTDAFNSISVSDIESVSILKDAASAAIYGSRANNGIVLITTKKGKSGKATVRINSQVGIQQHGKLIGMANKDQYVEMYNEAANNDNEFIDDPILQRQLISPEYTATLPDINHLEEIFRKALIQNHSISVSGGTDKTKYLMSGSYFNQEGIIIGSDYNRTTGKISLSNEVFEWLNIGTDINISQAERNIVGSSGDGYGGNGGSVVRYALFRTPAIPIYDENGDYVDLPENTGFFGDGYNPVGLANNTNNILNENRVFGNVNAKINFTKKLDFISTLGIDRYTSNQRRFNKTWGTNDRINNPNSLNVGDGQVNNWSWSNVLSYNTTFASNHNLSLMIGSEAIKGSGYNHNTTEREFPDQDLNLVYLGNGLGKISTSESIWGYSLISFFGRVNYSYHEKYLASATIRQDGSSRFNPEKRWGTFYSFSAGWRIDKEDFFDNISSINLLKLRAGYGSIGNQDVGYYAYSNQISSNFNYPFGGVSADGYAISVLGNNDVQWETSNQFDIGFDIGMFEGKLNLTADYFNKITSNMLIKEPIPSSAGYADPAWVNKGEILNSGFEFDLNFRQTFDDWRVSLTANLATLNNEVLELDGTIPGGRIDNGVYATLTEEGKPVGSFYLYEMEGIFQNDIDIITSAYQGDNIKPGDVKYKDQNNDGVIDEKDRAHVGSAIPDLTFGFNATIAYKAFDLSLFFQGAYGNEIYYQVATDIEGFYRPFNVTERYYDERWTGEGTSNTQPRASWTAKANNTKPSTRFMEDGSYLRLKNVQIGYTLPENLSMKIRAEKLRIYAVGHNLLTFTKYAGLDPEMTTSNNSASEGDRAAGIDWGTYPSAVSYSIGIQLTF